MHVAWIFFNRNHDAKLLKQRRRKCTRTVFVPAEAVMGRAVLGSVIIILEEGGGEIPPT